MSCVDGYGLALTGSTEAVSAYNHGVGALLRVQTGALESISASITLDPTFALGHAALALLGHEFCAPVDISARLRAAKLHARRSTARERSHVYAVTRHIQGDSRPLVRHLDRHPTDALLLSIAVPTIAFAGVTTVPEESWAIVERATPSYGDDWWFHGLLAFIRQEQRRFDEAMALSCRSLSQEPSAGQAAHARAHAHYETGDHRAGLSWLDGWITSAGPRMDNLSHYAWHAALHELSQGDLDGVRRRYDSQLAPPHVIGFRCLVDAGSLLWRWRLTPGASDVPDVDEVLRSLEPGTVEHPPTPFMAMHAAVLLCADDDADRLRRLAEWSTGRDDATYADVVAPLAEALRLLVLGQHSAAADALGRLQGRVWRLGGSDAQREVVEETRLAALLRAGRYDDARTLIDHRLDRRQCRRDEWFAERVSSG